MNYTTVSGDTFDIIAYKMYRDEKQALSIIESNIEYANVVIFSGGILLNIPEVKTVSTINLPPWKRGNN